jgi:hypothetical protein
VCVEAHLKNYFTIMEEGRGRFNPGYTMRADGVLLTTAHPAGPRQGSRVAWKSEATLPAKVVVPGLELVWIPVITKFGLVGPH